MTDALDDRPIFVLGRQHSGNTMLTMMLGRHSKIHGNLGESRLIERVPTLAKLPAAEKVRAMAEFLRRSSQPPLTPPVLAELIQHLDAALAAMPATGDPVARIADLTSIAMHWLAAASGKERWAQKATSYIFYVDRLRTMFPHSKLVFLARNPFDIAASLKKRGDRGDFVRATIAWNQGVQRAQAAAEADPEHVRIVRYEDLVSAGAQVMPGLMTFLDLDFEPQQLDIPHVNRSEQKYTLKSEQQGLSKSRIGYFTNELSPDEIALINHYTDREVLARTYPDLAAELGDLPTPGLVARSHGLMVGAWRFSQRVGSIFSKDPRSAVDRLVTRLRH